MATISITTTAQQDVAVQYACDHYNASTAGPAVTPAQYAKTRIDQLLNGLVQKYLDETRTTKAEAYQKATPEDQATIDAILAKYQ